MVLTVNNEKKKENKEVKKRFFPKENFYFKNNFQKRETKKITNQSCKRDFQNIKVGSKEN